MSDSNDPATHETGLARPGKRYDQSTISTRSELLCLVGEVNRLKILASLHGDRQLSIQGIARHVGGNPDVVSRHVKKLREAGLLEWVAIQDEDLRVCHHRLKPGFSETDEAGNRWINLGKVKFCLD